MYKQIYNALQLDLTMQYKKYGVLRNSDQKKIVFCLYCSCCRIWVATEDLKVHYGS